MLDHLRNTADLAVVYSVPRKLVEVASLERASEAPPGFRAETHEHCSNMFFRLVTVKHLPAQKTLSRKGLEHLHWHDLAVTLHSAVQVGETGDNIARVYTEPLIDVKQPHNPIAVLAFRHVSRDELQSSFFRWETQGSCRGTIPNTTHTKVMTCKLSTLAVMERLCRGKTL